MARRGVVCVACGETDCPRLSFKAGIDGVVVCIDYLASLRGSLGVPFVMGVVINQPIEAGGENARVRHNGRQGGVEVGRVRSLDEE